MNIHTLQELDKEVRRLAAPYLAQGLSAEAAIVKTFVLRPDLRDAYIKAMELSAEDRRVASNPTAEVFRLCAAKREVDPDLSEADAMNQVFSENPALYEQYRTSVTV